MHATYEDIDVKLDQRIGRPDTTIEKVGQRESKWHVLDALRLDHFCLLNKKDFLRKYSYIKKIICF